MMARKLILVSILIAIVAYIYYRPSGIKLGKLIQTNSGLVQGSVGLSRDGRDYYQWLKIPFAQKPLGKLRFVTPKPTEKWEGVLDATMYGPKCMQFGMFGLEGDEDCLHLNIHVPKLDDMESFEPMPVLVVMHGGGFVGGTGQDHGPDYFMDEQVVFITLNYRLGLFGFLSTGDKEIRGNMGLKDQVLALKWIKQNVQYFYGDPSKVTIIGPSAGGSSVHHLTLSKRTKGLFQKAAALGGVAVSTWAYTSAKFASERTKNYARQLHCPTENSREMTECLRELSASDIATLFEKEVKEMTLMDPTGRGQMISPLIEAIDDDEAFQTESPYDVLIEGRAQKVDLLLGTTADEGLMTSLGFIRNPDKLNEMEQDWARNIEFALYINNLPQDIKAEISRKLRDYYFPNSIEGQNEQEIINNYTRLYSAGFLHSALSQTASIQRKFSPVYLYYFNKSGGPNIPTLLALFGQKYHPLIEFPIFLAKFVFNNYILRLPPKHYGICHGDDFPLLMPYEMILRVPKDDQNQIYQLSKGFVKMITQFARNESMTLQGVPFTATPVDGKLKYFEIGDKLAMIEEPLESSMKFWESLKILPTYSQKHKL